MRRAWWRRPARTCAGCGTATRCWALPGRVRGGTRVAAADLVVPKPAACTFEQAAAVPMGDDGPARDPRRGRGEAGHRGSSTGRRRGGHVRRPDRGGAGRRGHRGVQHAQRRAGALDRRRARHRLHHAGLHRRADPVRRDPRQREQPPAVPAAPGADPERDPGAQRRRFAGPRVRARRWHLAGGGGQRVRLAAAAPAPGPAGPGRSCSP